MQFKCWLENRLFNEMPAIRLVHPEVLNTLDGESVATDWIDMRFEDWKKAGLQPPLGASSFAAPLADGWLNVNLSNPGFGTATVDSTRHAEFDRQSLQSRPYPAISSKWATFSEFLRGNRVVKPAAKEQDRRWGSGVA